MSPEIGTPVPYDATAVRPSYTSLPSAVRGQIEDHLGGPPSTVVTAGGGFTGGFAARLAGPSGQELFVKAAGPESLFISNAYSNEAANNRALPESIPAPRMRFSTQVDDWTVLGFEAVNGRAVSLPLRAEDWDLLLSVWAQAAEALTPAPQSLLDLGIVPMPTDDFKFAQSMAAGDIPVPQLPENGVWRIDELADLEQQLGPAIKADAIMHGDLRPDNMILGTDQAWICDWTMLNASACWFDTVAFLVLAQGDGHDANAMFWRHPTSRGVAEEQLDAVLAAIIGYYLCNADKPLLDKVSPYIRAHQRWNGLAALDWLASRRGW